MLLKRFSANDNVSYRIDCLSVADLRILKGILQRVLAEKPGA